MVGLLLLSALAVDPAEASSHPPKPFLWPASHSDDPAKVDEWFKITIIADNDGGPADWQILHISFPNGPSADRIRIVNPTTLENAQKYAPGTTEFPTSYGGGSPKYLPYTVVEGKKAPWDAGHDNSITVEVKPEKAGTLQFHYKTVAGKSGGILSDPSSGSKDGQNEYVRVGTIQVTSGQPPPPIDGALDSSNIAAIDHPTGTKNPGDSLTSTVTVKNTGTSSRSYWVGFTYWPPQGDPYDLPPRQTSTISPGNTAKTTFTWSLPSNAPAGWYKAHAAVYDGYNSGTNQMVAPVYDDQIRNNAFSVAHPAPPPPATDVSILIVQGGRSDSIYRYDESLDIFWQLSHIQSGTSFTVTIKDELDTSLAFYWSDTALPTQANPLRTKLQPGVYTVEVTAMAQGEPYAQSERRIHVGLDQVATVGVSQSKPAVVLLHGICSSHEGHWTGDATDSPGRGVFDGLNAVGHSIWAPTYHPSTPGQMITEITRHIAMMADYTGQESVIIVGHSNGGLMARGVLGLLYDQSEIMSELGLQPMKYGFDIERIVTLDSPDMGVALVKVLLPLCLDWGLYNNYYLERCVDIPKMHPCAYTRTPSWLRAFAHQADNQIDHSNLVRLFYANCHKSNSVEATACGPGSFHNNAVRVARFEGGILFASALNTPGSLQPHNQNWGVCLNSGLHSAVVKPDERVGLDIPGGPTVHNYNTYLFSLEVLAAATSGRDALLDATTGDASHVIRCTAPREHMQHTISASVADGTIGAVYATTASPSPVTQPTSQRPIAITADLSDGQAVFRLTSEDPAGRTVLLKGADDWPGFADTMEYQVTLDGHPVGKADSYEAVLTASGADPSYYNVWTEEGRWILVYVPHFSTRTLEVIPVYYAPSDYEAGGGGAPIGESAPPMPVPIPVPVSGTVPPLPTVEVLVPQNPSPDAPPGPIPGPLESDSTASTHDFQGRSIVHSALHDIHPSLLSAHGPLGLNPWFLFFVFVGTVSIVAVTVQGRRRMRRLEEELAITMQSQSDAMASNREVLDNLTAAISLMTPPRTPTLPSHEPPDAPGDSERVDDASPESSREGDATIHPVPSNDKAKVRTGEADTELFSNLDLDEATPEKLREMEQALMQRLNENIETKPGHEASGDEAVD